MKLVVVAPLVALAGFAAARTARELAKDLAPTHTRAEAPFAPSPTAAPIAALGYRELAADLLFVRIVGYFGSEDNEAHAMASLAEATAALDPTFRRPYELEAIAITAARRGVDNEARLRAIALLDQAARQYPTYWKYPNLAGQIYLVDLQTDDKAQRRTWDEKGAMLLESAARKPGAPAEAAMTAATLQSRFGQQQRAIDGLREILLITNDTTAKQRIVEKIAALAHQNTDEIAAELTEARHAFEHEWLTRREVLSPSLFVLLGARLTPGFDLGDLATGGRDVIGAEGFEHLEPVTDPPTH